MKITKRNPEKGSIDMLRREMDQFFDDLIPFSWMREKSGNTMESWMPTSDISEDDKEYLIKLDLPGMEKNDIKVSYQDKRVIISGERKSEEKEEKKDFIRKERYYGSFYRSFTLPEAVKEDNIQASFKDGVLKLVMPKTEVAKSKTIKVI